VTCELQHDRTCRCNSLKRLHCIRNKSKRGRVLRNLQDRASALDKVLIARHPTVQSSALFGYQGTILPDGDWRDATTNVLWENDRLPTRGISRS